MKHVAIAALLLASIAPLPADAADSPEASSAVAEVGLSGIVRGWRTSYGSGDTVLAYGMHGGWFARPWLEFTGSVDHARRSFDPADLRIRNTETWTLLGPRFSAWVQFVRFFAELGAGPVLRTVSYVDQPQHVRLSAGFGGAGGFAVVIGGRVGVSMRLGWRRRDDRSNILGTLDVSWLFQPSSKQ